MDSMWESMKKEIIKVRNGASGDKLYKLSEEYSVLSNQIVFISENTLMKNCILLPLHYLFILYSQQ